ncbi:hypothetical protein AB0C06_30320 [Micromonospora inaquosa]|uniref:hypothetical protein n=1 Tax=Micromonospora inaquosa TaxID=2203716 RepID=UPI003411B718
MPRTTPRICESAGCPQRLETTRANARYCSPKCRQRAYRQRSVALTIYRASAVSDDQHCDYCSKNLPTVVKGKAGLRLLRIDTVYCSDRCRGQAYRKRKRGEQLRKSAGISLPVRRGGG